MKGTPINSAPTLAGADLDLYQVFKRVRNCGGYKSATMAQKWRTIYNSLGLASIPHCGFELKDIYKKYAHLILNSLEWSGGDIYKYCIQYCTQGCIFYNFRGFYTF